MSTAPKDIGPCGSATAPKRRINPWIIAGVVSIAAFMEVLDTSIANVALPYMAGGLAASVDDASWVLTSYLVANAVVLPISGWLSLIFGRKRFYMACVVIFTVSSFLCGIAPSLGMLILFRMRNEYALALQPGERRNLELLSHMWNQPMQNHFTVKLISRSARVAGE
jgi:predicted MFS family arabinose efflux permease